MRESDFFAGDYLKASDLRKAATVTIKDVQRQEFENNGQKDYKPVLSFQGTDKQLVLNRTNFRTIADQHGEDTDDWIGRKITIFPTQVDFRGKQVMAIRVKMQPRPEPEPDFIEEPVFDDEPPTEFGITDDDIPF